MKKLIRILRLSSKEAIKDLKAKNPIYCNTLEKNFNVTNIFYQHILWYKKSRPNRETIERLSLINLIVKISKEWKLKETRKNWIFEWEVFKNTYKIILKIWWINFNMILWEKMNSNIILLSCFIVDYRKIE